MNYSLKVQKALKKIKIGDKIRIIKNNKEYIGILMPRSELGDLDSIVLKLSNGYNIGIKYEKGVKIEKIGKIKKIKKQKIEIKKNSNLPTISIISTGGTIVSKVDYETGGVKALESVDELLSNIPELQSIANFRFVQPVNKMSEDMEYTDWQKIAKAVAKELNLGNAVIVTHGTDTMHYTATALSFMLKNLSKPVVLVGSQRSSDRGSSDAFMNLICATYAALSDIGEVVICMHGTINDDYCVLNRGTRVLKMHKTRRDTFFGDYPLAKVYPNGRIEILNNYNIKKQGKVIVDTKYEPKVALVIAYPNSDPDILNYYLKKGYKGIIIEGTGMGHVPTNVKNYWIKTIKTISKKIPIVIVSQAFYGRINTNVYSNLRILFNETNAIPGEDMLPHVALLKLGFILGHTKKLDEIKKEMLKEIVKEISERSEI
ncbi:MAG: Glu-tRNA(Gln) amidotransferase subunit GatD [Candidatus Aenigmarchaeota archaeon]|nr:Glu-tRNA(Gln) amidotransferase subunit GatD [Candidatus Aenigmarchaeota archaeon]